MVGTMMTWNGIIIIARMMRKAILLPRKARWLSAYPHIEARTRSSATEITVTMIVLRK
jgi:hypothetical protein